MTKEKLKLMSDLSVTEGVTSSVNLTLISTINSVAKSGKSNYSDAMGKLIKFGTESNYNYRY